MKRWMYGVVALCAAPIVIFLVGVIGAAMTDESTVVRNASLAGVPIGGQDAEALRQSVTDLSERLPGLSVTIHAGDLELSTTAADLGISLNEEATIEAALEVGRKDKGPLKSIRWLQSLVAARPVPVSLKVDAAKADQAIVQLQGANLTSTTEPQFLATKNSITMAPGVVGAKVDTQKFLSLVPVAIEKLSDRIEIELPRVITPPVLSDEAVRGVVDQANSIVARPLTLRVLDKDVEVTADQLRAGFVMNVTGTEVSLGFRQEVIEKLVKAKLKPTANPTGVKFTLVNGVPTPVAGTDAVQCCGDNAPKLIVDALLSGNSTVTLEAKAVTAAEGLEWAKSLGVKEVVGEFTTKHPCCAARVKNIHRISDLTQGVLIAPGETFSANDFVGRRTKEKGFVVAGVIDQGEFVDDYGGGVSQWATTTFNAAFFAGLPIPDSKSHSVYLDRYPYGREATLAYPAVDLKIRNNTPYGVVIWPTYTGTSLTVQLYSTKFAKGEQTKMVTEKPKCGDVTVERTITNLSDGSTSIDEFHSYYDCDPPKHP